MSTNPSLVSVIIPAYNVEPWIGKAIDSVLAQTHEQLEILVTDDGSEDDTISVVNKYRDSRLRLLAHGTNRGVASARNSAMDAAKGKWLAILDADDWYHPKRIQSLLEEAERSGADVLGDNIHLLDESAARPWRKHFGSDLCRTLPRNIGIRDFLADMRLRSVKPFMSRLFIQAHNIRYREDYQTGEDVDLLLQCLIVGGVFRLIPDAYYYERRRHHSLRWSRLSHLNSLSKVWTDFTHIPEIAHAPECLALVRIRLEDLDEDIRYTKVIEPMLRGRWLAALTAACSDLSFFLLLLKRLPNMLSTRIRRLHARI